MLRNNSKTLLPLFFCAWVLYDILALSTYNSDWEVFKGRYESGYQDSDLFFNFLCQFFNGLGVKYENFYKGCQLTTYLAVLYFYNFFCKKGHLYLLIVLLLLIAPHLAILMQYYLAIAFLLVAVINYMKGRKRLFILFTILSVSTHTALILFSPFVLLWWYFEKSSIQAKINIGRWVKKLLTISFVCAVFLMSILSILSRVGIHVFEYNMNDDRASLGATLFYLIIYFSWFCSIYITHYKICKKGKGIEVVGDKRYCLLLCLNLFPIVYIFVSNLMILQFRCFEPLLICSITYLIYASTYLKRKKLIYVYTLGLILCTAVMKYYLLARYTGGGAGIWVENYTEILVFNEKSFLLSLFR